MNTEKVDFLATESSGKVKGLLLRPEGASALLVLGHGAGAPMYSTGMKNIADTLSNQGIATFRYNFPYMEKGIKRPDPPKVAQKTVRSAVRKALEIAPDLPLFAGGKSFGGRMTSQAASEELLPHVKGLIFYGFPLHAPGKAGVERGDHLKHVSVPLLFIQGTRDALAKLELISTVVKNLEGATMHVVDGGDHFFRLPKSMQKTDQQVQEGIAKIVREWISGRLN